MRTVPLIMNKLIVAVFFITNFSLTAQNEGSLNDYWKPPDGKRNRFSSYNINGLNGDNVTIKPSQYHTLCELKNTSGRIQRIWFTINSKDTLYLQDVKIWMTFDDENTVYNIPIGMFTGTDILQQ